jgi:tight adherence protein C
MRSETIIFLAIVFLVVASIAALGFWLIVPDRFRQRISALQEAGSGGLEPETNPWVMRIVQAAEPFVKLSLPQEGWDHSPMRLRFINAGWRNNYAPTLFFAAKTLLALTLPLLALVLGGERLLALRSSTILLCLTTVSAAGYYLPNIFLNHVVKKRQQEIFENFPDALDLLTICIEAGLGLDQAFAKVAGEIHLKSIILAQELQLVLMEMRTGFSKEQALRHLALRTGVEDVDMLVAMLIQSDRFGTSMGDSLRVHSDNLRSKRRQIAEEAAAKIALKLLFPLIFFVFPTLLLVLLGPALIQVYRVLLPAMGGQG